MKEFLLPIFPFSLLLTDVGSCYIKERLTEITSVLEEWFFYPLSKAYWVAAASSWLSFVKSRVGNS
jgi:hypothetical protein